MLSSLADDFLNCDRTDRQELLHARKHPFRTFELQSAVGVRPSVLRYVLPLNDTFLKATKASISKSIKAGQRIGRDWMAGSETRIETKEDSDESWVSSDDLRPLNDVCTKWCSKTFFPDAFSRVNMVANVSRLYSRLRDLTNLKFDICFKGGVMMRLVLLEFLHNFAIEGRVKAEKYMSEFHALSLSDFDFEIVPHNHDSDESMILRFLSLDYAVLLWLMSRMQEEFFRPIHSKSGLLYMKWDHDDKAEVLKCRLQEEIDGFEKSHPLYKAKVDRVVLQNADPSPPKGYKSKEGNETTSPRRNVVIYKCDGATCVLPASEYFAALGAKGIPTRAGQHLYCTLNTFIGEGEEKKRKGHQLGLFHLSRIKHGFVMYYTTAKGEKRCDRLGGEMIDLSQSHGTRHDQKRKDLYARVSHPYTSYSILGVDRQVVTLHSYSAHGFMMDLKSQLHNDADVPWESGSSKVSKRMLRYVAFLFLYVLGPYVPGSMAKKMIAFKHVAASTASVETLLAFQPTTVAALNGFVAQEIDTLRGAGKITSKIRAYVKTLHKHLSTLVACVEQPYRLYVDTGEADVAASQLLF
jgi:hypothetical protein